MKKSQIRIDVEIDKDNMPTLIKWDADDADFDGQQPAKAVLLSLFDGLQQNAMRIDLWTKDMSVDEMKKFYHQNIITLTDTYVRATGDEKTANKMRAFLKELGKDMNVLS